MRSKILVLKFKILALHGLCVSGLDNKTDEIPKICLSFQLLWVWMQAMPSSDRTLAELKTIYVTNQGDLSPPLLHRLCYASHARLRRIPLILLYRHWIISG